MRKIGLVLVVLALAVGFGVSAQAHDKGPMKVVLYTAELVNDRPQAIVDGPVVGSVVFKRTKAGVAVSVTVRDSRSPNMTFEVRLVPVTNPPIWSGHIDSLKTNKKGNGSVHATDTPDMSVVVDPTETLIKIAMRNDHDEVYYATELLTIDLQ